jgi:hypothetical protein
MVKFQIKVSRRLLLSLAALVVLTPIALWQINQQYSLRRLLPWAEERDVKRAIEIYGPAARERFLSHFARAGVAYPPAKLTFIGLKEERILEVWAHTASGAPVFICEYPVLAASGHAGPKLEEGDRQVPEGIYAIEYFNPNSRYHLSMKLDYPNAEDRAQAQRDGRTRLGGDIFIHGKSASIGCLAIGDTAIEEVFVMAAETGQQNIEVLTLPWDFRKKSPETNNQSDWMMQRYQKLAERIASFKK